MYGFCGLVLYNAGSAFSAVFGVQKEEEWIKSKLVENNRKYSVQQGE